MSEPCVIDKNSVAYPGAGQGAGRLSLKPPGYRHAVVRLDDAVDDAEGICAVSPVHVLLEDVDRAVAAGDVRGCDHRRVAFVPSRLHAEDVARLRHARAVVGHLQKIAAVGGRIVGDDLRAIRRVGPHAVLEVEPPHRQFDAFPLVLSPGMWEERDRPVPAATVHARAASGKPVPARERKRPWVVGGVAVPTPPRWKPNRRRISRAGRDQDHALGNRRRRPWLDQVAARNCCGGRDIDRSDRRAGRERLLGAPVGQAWLGCLNDPEPATCVRQPRHDLCRLSARTERHLEGPSRAYDAMAEDHRRGPHEPDQAPGPRGAVLAKMLRFDDPYAGHRGGRTVRVGIDRERPVRHIGDGRGALKHIAWPRSDEGHSRKSRGAHGEGDRVDNCSGRVRTSCGANRRDADLRRERAHEHHPGDERLHSPGTFLVAHGSLPILFGPTPGWLRDSIAREPRWFQLKIETGVGGARPSTVRCSSRATSERRERWLLHPGTLLVGLAIVTQGELDTDSAGT